MMRGAAVYTIEDRIVRALLLVVVADGRIDAAELAVVERIARTLCGVTMAPDDLRALARTVQNEPEDVAAYLAQIRRMLGDDERRALLAGLRAVARADGAVAERERLELAAAAAALGLDPSDA